jgi:hypothetical protein
MTAAIHVQISSRYLSRRRHWVARTYKVRSHRSSRDRLRWEKNLQHMGYAYDVVESMTAINISQVRSSRFLEDVDRT